MEQPFSGDISDLSVSVKKKTAARFISSVSLTIPNRSIISIASPKEVSAPLSINIYQPSGKLVLSIKNRFCSKAMTLINLKKTLPTGFHLYRISCPGEKEIVASGKAMVR